MNRISELLRLGRSVLLCGLLLSLAAVVAVWIVNRPKRSTPVEPDGFAGSQRQIPAYLNTAPEIKYVGDHTCSECHSDQATTYSRHPMARAMALAAGPDAAHGLARKGGNRFEGLGFEYLVSTSRGVITHRETKYGSGGKPLALLEFPIHYVLGSGTHGQAFVTNRDGYLFQSAVSWYSQKSCFDLSPGFTAGMHGQRAIQPDCLYCHCNQALPVPDLLNKYREPIIQGMGIGCERCHGPGELHVSFRQRGEAIDGTDYTIVNPRNLEPAEREAICQQCHLHGDLRILRRGKETYDFRPGLLLHHFRSVYVRQLDRRSDTRSLDQVRQMYLSRCFQASTGKLGCTSCHDPHALPDPADSVSYFRERCLTCHVKRGCLLPEAERRRQNKDDNCAGCHMPRLGTTYLAHTALTDHRILRKPAEEEKLMAGRLPESAGRVPIGHFHQNLLDLPQVEIDRDLGIALAGLGRQYERVQSLVAPLAEPLLMRTIESDNSARDARALGAWATILMMQGRRSAALEAFRVATTKFPEREELLVDLANLLSDMDRHADASKTWRKLVELSPHNAAYHARLASVLAALDQWPAVIQHCQKAMALNPGATEPRALLVRAWLRTGKNSEARVEFDKLLDLSPSSQADSLRRWYEYQRFQSASGSQGAAPE